MLKTEHAREELRSSLATSGKGDASLFASGREGLLALLRACEFPTGSEVIVQAYTCVVVPNAIHAAKLTTIYADIEKETLNIDPSSLESIITPRTKAVICQHTFGIPADVQKIREICDKNGLMLIEDCAHVLPDALGPEEIMSLGDAMLLSFGRDKAISGVSGGAIICRKETVSHRLQKLEKSAIPLPPSTIRRLLLYPIFYGLARPLMGLGLGKALLTLLRQLRLLVPIVTAQEKEGRQDATLHQMPEACAILALQQWKKLQKINDHRRSLTRYYLEASAQIGWPVLHGVRSDLPLQKYPMFVRDAEGIRRALKKKNIHLHDGWTGCVVCPASADQGKTGYCEGNDRNAEEVAEEILSLPTHPGMTEEDTKRLVSALTPFLR